MNIFTFDAYTAAQVIAVALVAIQAVKAVFEWLEKWSHTPSWLVPIVSYMAHGKGAWLISVLIPLLGTTVPEMVQDGALSIPEVMTILSAFGITIGSNLLYGLIRLKHPFKWLKKAK